MTREVIADDVVVEFGSTTYKNESDFFFELEWPSLDDDDEPVEEPVKKQESPTKRSGRPPRPPLRSLVSKAFITTCKEKSPSRRRSRSLPKSRSSLSRSRSFSFAGDSLDRRSLLSSDVSSDLTSDDLSVYTAPVPYSVPMEQRRLKKQMKKWRSRVSKSMRNVVAKKQYRTMSDKLYGGTQTPLKTTERRWYGKKASYQNPYEPQERNISKIARNEEVDSQKTPSYPSKNFDFATHSPTRTAVTEAVSSSQPNMAVSYENNCAQLVFSEKPFDEEEDRPFDERTFDSGNTSPSDEDSSAYESPPPSSPGDSPARPMGVSFSHPAFLKKQQAEKREDYGADWENLGDASFDGGCVAVNRGTGGQYGNVLRSRPLMSPNLVGPRDRYSVPAACRSSQNYPFDEAVSDSIVQSDPYRKELGFEVVPQFPKVLKLPSSGKKPKPAKPVTKKKRPECQCIKCSAKSVYADLYTC